MAQIGKALSEWGQPAAPAELPEPVDSMLPSTQAGNMIDAAMLSPEIVVINIVRTCGVRLLKVA